MLRFINSSYRAFGVSVDQIVPEISLNARCSIPRKKYHATCLGQKYHSIKNAHTLNQKSTIPETARRTCSGFVNDELKNSPASFKNLTVIMSEQRPQPDHASCGGVFQIDDQGVYDLTNSSDEEGSPMKKRHCSNVSQLPPDFRVWEPVCKRYGSEVDTFKFKVLSYNMLAQYLLEWHPYLYRECDTHCLKWKFRSMLLLEEITKMSPDILCLQEVQCSHIPTFYKRLEHIGYTGVFKQKTGHRQDGCAIYFKNSIFNMEDYVSVEFYQPDLPILNRDNIGIILKLTPRSTPETPFIVATTHLLFNPKRTDVRLAQIQVFLAEIDRFSYSGKKGKGHLPIILTGDFNSTPDSAVIHLLSCGNVSASLYRDGSDWKKIGVTDNCQHLAVYLSRQKGDVKRIESSKLKIYNSDYREVEETGIHKDFEENTEMFNSAMLEHSLNLKSVYNHTKCNGQKEATTFQNEWVTVDYIYFSSQSGLNLLERLYLPTPGECKILKRLPNDLCGSDHLPLGAIFELKAVKCSL